MSYDIWLEVNVGGDEPVTLEDPLPHWNYTSNMAPAWRAAGADLADFDGKRADECLPLLEAALETMRANFADYSARFDAPNGWGSMDTLIPALEDLAAGFKRAPLAFVGVWR